MPTFIFSVTSPVSSLDKAAILVFLVPFRFATINHIGLLTVFEGIKLSTVDCCRRDFSLTAMASPPMDHVCRLNISSFLVL